MACRCRRRATQPLPPDPRPVVMVRLRRGRYEVRPIIGHFLPLLPLDRRLVLSHLPCAPFDCGIGNPLTLRGRQRLRRRSRACVWVSPRGARSLSGRWASGRSDTSEWISHHGRPRAAWRSSAAARNAWE